jgi:hypothetical protein
VTAPHGYVHTSRLTGGIYQRQWPVLLADTQLILEQVRRLGVGVCGPDGFGAPLLDSRHGIAFNGDAATGRHRDPLQISPPVVMGQPVGRSVGSYDTGQYPYDLAVAAVLFRARQLMGDDFAVGRYGPGNSGWNRACVPGLPTARHLVTDLFGNRR